MIKIFLTTVICFFRGMFLKGMDDVFLLSKDERQLPILTKLWPFTHSEKASKLPFLRAFSNIWPQFGDFWMKYYGASYYYFANFKSVYGILEKHPQTNLKVTKIKNSHRKNTNCQERWKFVYKSRFLCTMLLFSLIQSPKNQFLTTSGYRNN